MKKEHQQQPTNNNGNTEKKHERTLDEASSESFPASDAPAWNSHDTQPKKPQNTDKDKKD